MGNTTDDFDGYARRALRAAQTYLDRYPDRYTRSARDDLAQESLIEFWRSASRLRDPGALEGYVRRIAQRRRYRALQVREDSVSLDSDRELAERALAQQPESRPRCRVGGRSVDVDWLMRRLADALGHVEGQNERLLRGYYDGRTCAELGADFGLPRGAVKARLHRTRVRLREEIERCVQGARATEDVWAEPTNTN